MSQAKVLLMEDDAILGYALKEYLELENFEVAWEQDGASGVERFSTEPFNICIIDIMMPQKDGYAVAKDIKAIDDSVPFLFLTARSQKVDKLKGFRLGAEDFIVKPIDEEELIARLDVILRRNSSKASKKEPIFQLGKFTFFPHKQRLIQGDKHIDLTGKETQLLHLLSENLGQLLTREAALIEIWGSSDYFTRRTMDVHIARLRNYLKRDPSLKITNVHSKGFILELL